MGPHIAKHHNNDGSFLERSTQHQHQLRDYIASQPAEKFAGKPWDLVQEIEDFASQIQMRMIFRGEKITISKEALAAMEPPPKVILEFGTFVGTSAIAWGAMLKEFNANAKDVKVYTFEFDPGVAATARDLIKAAGLQDVIEVLVGPGADSLKKLHAEGRVRSGEVDMVFIDHWEQYYLPDLKLCEELKLFHVGSLVIADNTDMPGAPDYLEYVKKGGDGPIKYESQSLHSGDTEGPTIVEVSKVVAL